MPKVFEQEIQVIHYCITSSQWRYHVWIIRTWYIPSSICLLKNHKTLIYKFVGEAFVRCGSDFISTEIYYMYVQIQVCCNFSLLTPNMYTVKYISNVIMLINLHTFMLLSQLKGYSDILWSEVHFFFTHFVITVLHIQKELSYTSLTSIGFLQEQSSFYQIRRSLHFFKISDAWALENTVQYSMEKYN